MSALATSAVFATCVTAILVAFLRHLRAVPRVRRLVLAALRPRVNWPTAVLLAAAVNADSLLTSAMLLAFAVGAYLARDVVRNEWRS